MKPYLVISKTRLWLAVGAFVAAAGVCALLLTSLPAVTSTAAGGTKRKLPIYCTDRQDKVVSLTFDAAWGDEDTPHLIEIFDQYDVSVTFFVVGEWADRCSDSVKALCAAGHEVMNHSDSHPHMPQLSAEGMTREIRACNDKLKALTGVCPVLFRAPYGDYDNTLLETLETLGMYCVQWDVDSLDWKGLSASEITERVTSRVQSGSIVLFHNAAEHTPEALPAIIEALKAEGYTFLKASEMIYREEYTINHEGRQCKTEQ